MPKGPALPAQLGTPGHVNTLPRAAETDAGLPPARGIIMGLVFVAPLWVLIALAIYFIPSAWRLLTG